MAHLSLYKSNYGFNETSYYESYYLNMVATGWFQATSEGIIFSQLTGNGITYNQYDAPVLGTVTSARSINIDGDNNWVIKNIGVQASNINVLRQALRTGNAFTSDMVNVVLSGNDTIFGTSGDDYIVYSSGKDSINGSGGIDTIDFSEYANYNKGNRSDTLTVNLKSFSYEVTTSSNVVVKSNIYNIENIIASYYDDKIIGNNYNNKIYAGAGSDIIYGGLGDDYIDGGSTYSYDQDQMYGEDGNDFIVVSNGNNYVDGGTGSDTVSYYGKEKGIKIDLLLSEGKHGYYYNNSDTWQFTDTLKSIENVVGTTWSDTILGNNGNNTICGGGGDDVLNGKNGIDTLDYKTNGYNGVTVNLNTNTAFGQGLDTIYNFENINGSNHNDVLIGNVANNSLNGNNGNDTIIGNGGLDTINGGLGNDKLTGGSANDIFLFNSTLNSSTNKDKITDFAHNSDKIRLDRTVFNKITTLGTLNSSNFRSSSTGKAQDNNDYMLYNTTTGVISYDQDGNGSGVAVQFAVLTNKPSVTSSDFFVVA